MVLGGSKTKSEQQNFMLGGQVDYFSHCIPRESEYFNQRNTAEVTLVHLEVFLKVIQFSPYTLEKVDCEESWLPRSKSNFLMLNRLERSHTDGLIMYSIPDAIFQPSQPNLRSYREVSSPFLPHTIHEIS